MELRVALSSFSLPHLRVARESPELQPVAGVSCRVPVRWCMSPVLLDQTLGMLSYGAFVVYLLVLLADVIARALPSQQALRRR